MEERREEVAKVPTSLDVAKRAGVSRTTVSYILNGVRSEHVSEATRVKVLQAVRELGYQAHASARALRKGHGEEIGLITDVPFTMHRTEMFVAMQQRTLWHGYMPVTYMCNGLNQEQKQELLLKIYARRPLGLIGSPFVFNEENRALAHSMGIENVVLISSEPVDYQYALIFPTRQAGFLVGQHLLERKHRYLALIEPEDPTQTWAMQQRIEGLQEAMQAFPGSQLEIFPLRFSSTEIHTFVEQILKRPEHPTGIYAFNDEYAIALLAALRDCGICVPAEIAVVGTDDIMVSEYVRPALTTICFDNLSLAERAVDMLVARHRGEAFHDELARPLIPRLIVRSSS